MAKLIQHPGAEVQRIRKETTLAASKINAELKRLQTILPGYIFKVEFETQKLGKQNFYQVKIKTFKDQ